uniref:PKcGMP_CC domain-containing protein n=1 Tax=Macrostomum lignano TaxID=282301 RepID=A0A1I8G6Z9_9PLAT
MEQSEQEAEADDNISTEAARESAAGLDEDIAKAEKEIRLLQLRKEAAQLKREIGDLQRECPSTRPMNRERQTGKRSACTLIAGGASGRAANSGTSAASVSRPTLRPTIRQKTEVCDALF